MVYMKLLNMTDEEWEGKKASLWQPMYDHFSVVWNIGEDNDQGARKRRILHSLSQEDSNCSC